MTRRDTLISKEENAAMFNGIARRYDVMNRFISLGLDKGWRKAAISALSPQSGGMYLDIGCGTADLSADIAAAAPEATVIGLDPSRGMLESGQKKVSLKKLQNRISFLKGDAVRLPSAESAFDGIILGFSVRNMEQRAPALLEMHRVLKKNGRLIILELSVPKNKFISFFYRLHTHTALPLVAGLFADKTAYDYLVRSVEAFPPPDIFVDSLRAAGFVKTSARPLTLGAVHVFYAEKK